MRGFLIGDVRFIPSDVYQRFKDTGTLHVLAASGSNVGYVTLTIFLVARLVSFAAAFAILLAIVGVSNLLVSGLQSTLGCAGISNGGGGADRFVAAP